MTRQPDQSGNEVVKLGNFERAIGALFFLVLIAIAGYVASDHEAIASIKIDVAVIHEQIKAIPRQP